MSEPWIRCCLFPKAKSITKRFQEQRTLPVKNSIPGKGCGDRVEGYSCLQTVFASWERMLHFPVWMWFQVGRQKLVNWSLGLVLRRRAAAARDIYTGTKNYMKRLKDSNGFGHSFLTCLSGHMDNWSMFLFLTLRVSKREFRFSRSHFSLSRPMDKAKISDDAWVILKKLRAGKRYTIHIITIYSRRSQLFFTSDKPLRPYLMKARWIAQSIHPFINSFLRCS